MVQMQSCFFLLRILHWCLILRPSPNLARHEHLPFQLHLLLLLSSFVSGHYSQSNPCLCWLNTLPAVSILMVFEGDILFPACMCYLCPESLFPSSLFASTDPTLPRLFPWDSWVLSFVPYHPLPEVFNLDCTWRALKKNKKSTGCPGYF